MLSAFSQPVAAQDATPRSDRLGITFISSADHPADDTRYRQALLLGAGWNRFPMYWQQIERAAGTFDWSVYDRVVLGDVSYGLKINAILMGLPEFHRDGGSVRSLDAPVFSDGSDTPGAGKSINGNNPWAVFVANAVARYAPGGAFGSGVDVWEVWNEPDLTMFWTGSTAQYARLLKVAYLAAHHANPNAQVMFGGLAYVNPDASDWLASVLAIIAQDPAREANRWYMDKVAVHNYSNPWRSGWVIERARQNLARYGLTRPIWLNESGVPVWDDYPGPTWAANAPEQRRWRATAQQQAAFVVQSTAYAWASGAEVVFIHQLYDDCGNQAAGTDFPPNNGDICSGGACWGDAHGLFRNDRNAVCFRQSPMPGTARPAAGAFHLLAQVFGGAPFGGGTILDLADQGVVIAFDRPATSQRIFVLWNTTQQQITLDVPASGSGATLYGLGNQDYYIEPNGETRYQIGLPPAQSGDAPTSNGSETEIGGSPFILVEQVANLEPLNPALVALEPFDASQASVGADFRLPPAERIQPTPGSILGGLPAEPTPAPLPTAESIVRPTVDPGRDTTAPSPFMLPLPIISPATFTVTWGARDDGGIANYIVWVRENGGEWQPWLEGTTTTQADYIGQPGGRYEFAVWAQDLAGNWSLNSELTPQAQTAIQQE